MFLFSNVLSQGVSVRYPRKFIDLSVAFADPQAHAVQASVLCAHPRDGDNAKYKENSASRVMSLNFYIGRSYRAAAARVRENKRKVYAQSPEKKNQIKMK